jgi:hypothetical protein
MRLQKDKEASGHVSNQWLSDMAGDFGRMQKIAPLFRRKPESGQSCETRDWTSAFAGARRKLEMAFLRSL